MNRDFDFDDFSDLPVGLLGSHKKNRSSRTDFTYLKDLFLDGAREGHHCLTIGQVRTVLFRRGITKKVATLRNHLSQLVQDGFLYKNDRYHYTLAAKDRAAPQEAPDAPQEAPDAPQEAPDAPQGTFQYQHQTATAEEQEFVEYG